MRPLSRKCNRGYAVPRSVFQIEMHTRLAVDAVDLFARPQIGKCFAKVRSRDTQRQPLARPAPVESEHQPRPLDLSSSLRSQEHRRIAEVLRETSGNRKHAAERLGISPRTLRYKLAQMRDAGMTIPGREGTV